MSPEDVRTVFYAVALIALAVVAGYLLLRYGAPSLFRNARSLDPERKVAAVALFVVGALGLFPPWNYTFQAEGSARTLRPAPRTFVFAPPAPKRSSIDAGVVIDYGRLLTEWLAIGMLATALAIVLRPKDRPWFGPGLSRRPEVEPVPASPQPSSPGRRILGPKQTQYLIALAKLRAAGKLKRGEWPRDVAHLESLFRSLTPEERAWPQSARVHETLPKQTPAEVAKMLALFPPDDGSKIN